jgi:hypothetical protein
MLFWPGIPGYFWQYDAGSDVPMEHPLPSYQVRLLMVKILQELS